MGYKIKDVREQKGLTQEELALKSGVSRTTIVGLEKGTLKHTTTKTLLSIANALGVSVHSIFFADSV